MVGGGRSAGLLHRPRDRSIGFVRSWNVGADQVLIVIAPATSNRLTTVNRARALLGFDNPDDAAVDVLIDKASEAIAEWCRRPFALETVRETNYEHSRPA